MNSRTLNRLAHQNFERAMQKAFWRDLICRLTQKENNLLPFNEFQQSLPFKGQCPLGLQVVSIDQVVGSVGRYREFDRAFFPRQDHSKERWINIDRAYYEQVSLPPVDLIKVGDIYFVKDGHHRVSVARTRGQAFIDAYVTEIEASVPVEQ